LRLLDTALAQRRIGNYQLQAAIAAVHCEATSAEETDWRQIVALYEELLRRSSSAVVALNHAAAVAMHRGPEQGLNLMEAARVRDRLENYYLYHAARADLLRRANRPTEAAAAYERALSLTTNLIEQNYIRRRLHETHK
jgi:RNA polymerase sigma-70 factor (ECF subfamily)